MAPSLVPTMACLLPGANMAHSPCNAAMTEQSAGLTPLSGECHVSHVQEDQ
jgi:hypothetical protein